MTPNNSSLKKSLVKNIIYAFGAKVAILLVNFFLLPFNLSKLGPEQFGLWVICYTFFTYFTLLDLGIGGSLVKFIAEYKVKNDYSAINRFVSTAFFFTVILGLPILVGAFLITPSIVNLLITSKSLQSDATFAIRGISLVFIINNIYGGYSALLQGLQRFDLVNKVLLIALVPSTIGTIVLLNAGFGIRGLTFTLILSSVVTNTSYTILGSRIFPALAIRLQNFSLEILRQFWNYGYKLQLNNISLIINVELDKLLVGFFLSLSLVSFYEVGGRAARTLSQLPVMAIGPIMPVVSALDAKEDKVPLEALYYRGMRYMSILVFAMALFSFAAAPALIASWVGPGYELSVRVLQVLIVNYCLNVVSTGIGTSLVRGIGKPEYETYYTVLSMLLNLGFTLILAIGLGFWGIILGTVLSTIIASLYFFFSLHHLLDYPVQSFVREIWLPYLGITVLLALPVGVIMEILQATGFFNSRLNALLSLAGGAVFFFGSYTLVLLFNKNLLDEADRKILKRFIYLPKRAK